jgi:hypothetical protein
MSKILSVSFNTLSSANVLNLMAVSQSVGMRLRTLKRPRFRLCFIDLRFNNEDAGASTAAFQRGALEQ